MTFGLPRIQKASVSPYIPKLILVSLGSLLLLVTAAGAQKPKETKRVLILFTGQKDLPDEIRP
jgi:hypothetical protein